MTPDKPFHPDGLTTLTDVGRRVLILGGTSAARRLAQRLDDAGLEIVSSLAGRVAEPQLPVGSVRIGGFGGAKGLAQYLRDEKIVAVVDATHPFAAQITAHAAAACAAQNVPLLIVDRPAWAPVDGDRWTLVPSLDAAASAVQQIVGPDAHVLLTIGRQGASAFAVLPQRFWIRALETPGQPLPDQCEILLQRGPFDLTDERELLQRLEIDLIVSKNSGGPMTSAKLDAARELRLPILMIARPSLPAALQTTDSVDAAATWAHAAIKAAHAH